MKKYDHKEIEPKWRKKWQEQRLYKTHSDTSKPKCYVLDMFPYPSGDGLHVGHPKGYIATDIFSRYRRMNGHEVLHPMGWDAFGLPAEQYAIKHKVHPSTAVHRNTERFKEQMSVIGFDHDWDREINTTDPNYYKWTQWIFLQLYKEGLAYESYEPINWCPTCQTGLANEDLEGNACERCGTVVEKRPMRQWVLKITDYADRLLDDLSGLDWPESIKESQKNWIGKSEGALISFPLAGAKAKHTIDVFTTRPDTLFGATYVVLAPEHALLSDSTLVMENREDIESYIQDVQKKTEIERTSEGKEKTGVRIEGVQVINPATKEEIPVFVADYVLGHYGTGAIMAVPAHDERDMEFARTYSLSRKNVISPEKENADTHMEDAQLKKILNAEEVYVGRGKLRNSGKFDGMDSTEAKKAVTDFVDGKMKTTYKLRDWVFSRQRYWGEPIPIVHCEKCGVVPVPEDDLPVVLPNVEHYEPTGTGESPLAGIEEWVRVSCPKCDGDARRETNTMPQWAGSSWYYLRYIDPHNTQALIDPKKEKYWMPVDMYVGGAEHATRHLIYARFWHKFLYDRGRVSTLEPFMRLQHVGIILAEDGRKMSKRWGNVVNPDDIVRTYGADTLRLYEMFMGPFGQSVAWSTESIVGPRRFLERLWSLFVKNFEDPVRTAPEVVSMIHRSIKKVGEDIERFRFNTAVSQMMILLNEMEKSGGMALDEWKLFVRILAPFAPHICEEMWSVAGEGASVHLAEWPKYSADLLADDSVTIGVQVNGRVRGSIHLELDAEEGVAVQSALEDEKIRKHVSQQEIKKVIYVKNRILNIIT